MEEAIMGKKKNNGKTNRDIIAGLDLGTTKTSVIIAERHENTLSVVGLGTSPALGMKQGMVVNIEQTVESIVKAVEAAEQMANVQLESVWAGIAGDHIKSVNSRGMIAVGRAKNGLGSKISREDIQRVIETAQTVTFPADRDVLHVIPQEFLVDDRNGFKDPVGIVGTRLEANVHIITAALSAAQTILYCLQEAGVILEDLVLQPLASAMSTLTNDDRELGVALVDVGGGTADIAVFYDGSIRHTAVIGLGGDNVTRDLAHGLRTPMHVAEKIKLDHGCAHASRLTHNEPVVIPGGDDRPDRHVSQDILCAIIQPRMEEIFDLVVKELRSADCLHKLTAGVVLTGGAALVPGAVDIGEEVFNLPVRLARPTGLNGLKEMANSPIYATSVGLILHGSRQQDVAAKSNGSRGHVRRQDKMQGSKFQNFKRWLGDVF
jgi:cell division protein FtsA